MEIRTVSTEGRRLVVEWGDGHVSQFPFVWLRHEEFFGSTPTGTPLRDRPRLPDDPAGLAVAEIRILGATIEIDWAEDGATTHAAEWLRAHCPSDESRIARRHQPVCWDGASLADRPWFSASELDDPSTRLGLLREVLDRGLAKVWALPGDVDGFERLVAHFGPIHETGYGRLFDVRTDSTLELGANTAKHLGPHTDENYRHSPPGISFFECVVSNSSGGESIYVDGFAAAGEIRRRDPETFEALTSVGGDFALRSAVSDYRASGAVVSLDRDGEIAGIRFTDRTVDPPDVALEAIEPWYRAMRVFGERLYEPAAQFTHRLAAGEAIVFDNHRVLHGRTEFDPSAGLRHLRQAAIDRNEFHSNLRVLAAELGDPLAELHYSGGARA